MIHEASFCKRFRNTWKKRKIYVFCSTVKMFCVIQI